MTKTLDKVVWKEFKVKQIFSKIEKCKCGNVGNLEDGLIPYVGATNRNNGTIRYINAPEKFITKGNCIVFICDGQGSVGYSIYKTEDFVGSTTLKVGRNKFLNYYNAQFIIGALDKNRCIYSYGYKRTEARLKNETIYLPVNQKSEPDYKFMEEYIKERETRLKNQYKEYTKPLIQNLQKVVNEKRKWNDFFIEEIAIINSGRDIYERERIAGDIPYITSTAQNNGIGYLVSNNNETIEANCLSVNRNGSVGYCFYHPYSALYSNDCRKLRLKNNSKYVGLFISNVITAQKSKYGYGYKMGTGRLKRQKIMLPVNSKGEPDYQYMEDYMKYLEQKKILKYLDYIK